MMSQTRLDMSQYERSGNENKHSKIFFFRSQELINGTNENDSNGAEDPEDDTSRFCLVLFGDS